MKLFGLRSFPPTETLPSSESRARFHNLVLDVIGTLAGIRMLTMVRRVHPLISLFRLSLTRLPFFTSCLVLR